MGKNSKKSQPEVGITEQLVLGTIMEDRAKEAEARTEMKLRKKNAKKKRRQLVKQLNQKVAEVCDHLLTENSTEGSELITVYGFAGYSEVDSAPGLNFTVRRYLLGVNVAAWVSPGTLALVPELHALAVASIDEKGDVWTGVEPSAVVPTLAILFVGGESFGDEAVGEIIDWLDTLLPVGDTTS